MSFLVLLAHFATVSPDAECRPAIEPGSASALYYVTAVPMDEEIDEPDTDLMPAGGSGTSQGIGEEPETADESLGSAPDIV